MLLCVFFFFLVAITQMPLWILTQILSCAAQWGLGLSHLCRNKFFLYGRLFSKCCFQAVNSRGFAVSLRWGFRIEGRGMRLLCWIYGYWSFTGLGWNIEQHSFYFVVHLLKEGRSRSHPFWGSQTSIFCIPTVLRAVWRCCIQTWLRSVISSVPLFLTINERLTFLWDFEFVFLSSLGSVMHQCNWINFYRGAVLCHHYITVLWRGRECSYWEVWSRWQHCSEWGLNSWKFRLCVCCVCFLGLESSSASISSIWPGSLQLESRPYNLGAT